MWIFITANVEKYAATNMNMFLIMCGFCLYFLHTGLDKTHILK